MKYRICIIICYFGQFPSYFKLWLKTAAFNSTIDFKIYSDILWEDELPNNVSIIKSSLDDIKRKTEDIVGFEVSLERAYKLCDYRPLYGQIFKSDLENYDFWGYCDLDIMMGNIRTFITDDVLDKYDKINRWGHLSFHRNTKECNSRYLLPSRRYSYKQILSNTRDFGFDEYDYTHIYNDNKFPILILKDEEYADIRARFNRFRTQGINYDQQIFYWDNGKVFRKFVNDGKTYCEEYLYIHFKKRGSLPLNFRDSIENINSFYITNLGFYERNGFDDTKKIIELNRYPGKIVEIAENIKYECKSKCYKFKRKYFE